MEISSHQAADALNEVALAQRRLSILRGYGFAAPHLFLWGCVWILGYTLAYVQPRFAAMTWLVLDVVGFAGSTLIGRRSAARRGWAIGVAWRYAATFVTVSAFIMATYVVLQPQSSAQFGAFPALIIAALYVGLGIWRGLRWALAGIALGALTVGGYLWLTPYFLPWMALAGGGTLLLAGFWLRRI